MLKENDSSELLPLSVTQLCVGCGNCEAICPHDAVHTNTGKANLVEETCVAFDGTLSPSGMPKCLACVRHCPVPGAFEVNSQTSRGESHF